MRHSHYGPNILKADFCHIECACHLRLHHLGGIPRLESRLQGLVAQF